MPTQSLLRLPPEIIDIFFDLLSDDKVTLNQCCLVFKRWVPHARRQLFKEIQFLNQTKLEAWKETFPDPASSPSHYARLLDVHCLEAITARDAEEGGWIRSFTNVTRLGLRCTAGRRLKGNPFDIIESTPDTGSDDIDI